MSASLSAWMLLLLGMVLANVPFVILRDARGGVKPVRWQLLGLILAYALWLAAGFWLESRMTQPWRQGWAFYVITGMGFLVCAFPGFVYAHLGRRGR